MCSLLPTCYHLELFLKGWETLNDLENSVDANSALCYGSHYDQLNHAGEILKLWATCVMWSLKLSALYQDALPSLYRHYAEKVIFFLDTLKIV